MPLARPSAQTQSRIAVYFFTLDLESWSLSVSTFCSSGGASLIMAAIAQINIWRVLCYTGKRGQDVANEVVYGLGFVLAGMIALGGLAFNIGNVGGGGLGLFALVGIPTKIGYVITALLAIVIFLSKSAKSLIDQVVKYLGALMIVVILIVMPLPTPSFPPPVSRQRSPLS